MRPGFERPPEAWAGRCAATVRSSENGWRAEGSGRRRHRVRRPRDGARRSRGPAAARTSAIVAPPFGRPVRRYYGEYIFMEYLG